MINRNLRIIHQISPSEGNALFLVLIAVALFAALSYAATQSTRSGSTDFDSDKGLVSAAQLSQYPPSVWAAAARMAINGIAFEDIYFDPPSHFDSSGTSNTPELIEDADASTLDETRAIFHPKGGGAVFDRPRPDLMADGTAGSWVFTDLFEIENIGISVSASPDGNDLVAFLPGVSLSACKQLNDSVCSAGSEGDSDGDGDGIPAGPTSPIPDADLHAMLERNAPGFDVAEVARIGGAFSGRACGCYDASDADPATSGPYIYFHAVLER